MYTDTLCSGGVDCTLIPQESFLMSEIMVYLVTRQVMKLNMVSQDSFISEDTESIFELDIKK